MTANKRVTRGKQRQRGGERPPDHPDYKIPYDISQPTFPLKFVPQRQSVSYLLFPERLFLCPREKSVSPTQSQSTRAKLYETGGGLAQINGERRG